MALFPAVFHAEGQIGYVENRLTNKETAWALLQWLRSYKRKSYPEVVTLCSQWLSNTVNPKRELRWGKVIRLWCGLAQGLKIMFLQCLAMPFPMRLPFSNAFVVPIYSQVGNTVFFPCIWSSSWDMLVSVSANEGAFRALLINWKDLLGVPRCKAKVGRRHVLDILAFSLLFR